MNGKKISWFDNWFQNDRRRKRWTKSGPCIHHDRFALIENLSISLCNTIRKVKLENEDIASSDSPLVTYLTSDVLTTFPVVSPLLSESVIMHDSTVVSMYRHSELSKLELRKSPHPWSLRPEGWPQAVTIEVLPLWGASF